MKKDEEPTIYCNNLAIIVEIIVEWMKELFNRPPVRAIIDLHWVS